MTKIIEFSRVFSLDGIPPPSYLTAGRDGLDYSMVGYIL